MCDHDHHTTKRPLEYTPTAGPTFKLSGEVFDGPTPSTKAASTLRVVAEVREGRTKAAVVPTAVARRKALEFAEETGNPVVVAEVLDAATGLLRRVGMVWTAKADPLSTESFDDWAADLATELEALAAAEVPGMMAGVADLLDLEFAAVDIEALRASLSSRLAVPPETLARAQQIVMRERLAGVVRSVGGAMAKQPAIRGTIGAGLSLPDRELGSLMSRFQSFFVRDQYGRVSQSLGRQAAEVINRGLASGLGRVELGRELQATISGGLQMRGYWQTVAANAIGHARSYTQGASMRAAGIEAFRIIAVVDDVTCFSGATCVTMGDKSVRPIRDVAVGDVVLSCKGIPRRVTAKRATPKKIWMSISTSSGATIMVTPNHPLLTSEGWVRAVHVRENDQIACDDGNLQGLWEDVPEKSEVAGVLLGGVQDGGESLSALREVVPGSSDIHQEGSIQVLLGPLQEGEPAQRVHQGGTDRGVRDVREGVFLSSVHVDSGYQEKALLQEMQPSEDEDSVSRLRKDFSAENDGSEVLLYLMLPKARRGDQHRDNRQDKSGGGKHRIRAGTANKTVVCRLPGRGSDSDRGGRGILAQPPQGRQEGREKGCRHDKDGADRNQAIGTPGQDGTKLRDQRIAGLWPRPSRNLANTARFTTVTSVEIYVLEKAKDAYDLTVEDDAGYIAEGIVAHNTDWCLYLDGKIVPVGGAMALMDRQLAAATPEDFMDAHPLARQSGDRIFHRYSDGREVDLLRVITPGEHGRPGNYAPAFPAGELVDASVGLSPYHHGCRSTFVAV